NGASARLLLAMVISLTVVNVGVSLLVMAAARRRYGVASVLEPMPAALLLVALSVLVSRLAGLSPGFLFGLVVGVAFARELRKREDGILAVLGIGATILLGVAAWFGYGLLGADGSGFWYELSRETLVAITLESVGTIVITLLPLEFLDGKVVFRWSKLAWLATYIVGLVVFLLVVVPLSDNWGEASAPLLGWGALFALFAVLAIGIWAYFRFVRPRGAHVADGAEEAEPAR